jgi:hypothetical protein
MAHGTLALPLSADPAQPSKSRAATRKATELRTDISNYQNFA